MPEQTQDKGLKRLLSQRKNFLQFIKKYIDLYFVATIQEDDLQLIDKSFIDGDFRKRESDIVYRVKNDEQDVIFYIILEMQTKVDHTMPIRLLFYITELLRRIFYDTDKKVRERKDFRMPAVVPLILYIGEHEWTAVRSYREYTNQGDTFGDHILDFRYEMLDLRAIQQEMLESGDSSVDAVLLANKLGLSKQPDMVLSAIGKLLPRISVDQWPDIMDYLIDVTFKHLHETNSDLLNKLREAFEKGDASTVGVALDAFERALIERERLNRREGRAEGRVEGQLHVAQRMKNANFDKELILEMTGISEEDYEKLD